MADLTAVYLDLTDPESARLWRWLRVVGVWRSVEIRPFCASVEDPWDCEVPPFGLELLMMLEHTRGYGQQMMGEMLDVVFDRRTPRVDVAHAELGLWLEIGQRLGLDLAAYDADREQLRAEVGYWQEEAILELGVDHPSTLVFDDGSVMRVQLHGDLTRHDEANALLDKLCTQLTASGSGADL